VPTISSKELLINEEIRESQVRVIDVDSSQLGILATKEAIRVAGNKNLDLVLIAPTAQPPVCRIMDYGKYRFEQTKKDKEAKKNQRVISIKEIQLSVKIDIHDFNTKVGHALRFLNDGDKCKVCVRFYGREMAHTELGNEILKRFADACQEVGVIEKPGKLEGRNMIMFLAPKQQIKQN
jgi:translation initiation factor IF-3